MAGAVGVADATHRLDDIARSIGIKPRPRPMASDDVLIGSVAEEQNVVLARIEGVAAQHPDLAKPLAPCSEIAQAHLNAVGGTSTVPPAAPVNPDPAVAVGELARSLSRASAARARDAGKAVSPDLARVLSSMSAGLEQCASTVRDVSA